MDKNNKKEYSTDPSPQLIRAFNMLLELNKSKK